MNIKNYMKTNLPRPKLPPFIWTQLYDEPSLRSCTYFPGGTSAIRSTTPHSSSSTRHHPCTPTPRLHPHTRNNNIRVIPTPHHNPSQLGQFHPFAGPSTFLFIYLFPMAASSVMAHPQCILIRISIINGNEMGRYSRHWIWRRGGAVKR